MSTESPYHFNHLLQVSNISLSTLILYIFFNVCPHVYSPGTGVDNPLGDKILMSTERSYHFAHLVEVSKTFL